jgi:hypothetical protein
MRANGKLNQTNISTIEVMILEEALLFDVGGYF